jgi:phosphoribosylglycinamide formyltransferase-1
VVLGIVGSGKGSNCAAILEAIHQGELDARPGVVISDVADAGILEVAAQYSVPSHHIAPGKFKTRLEPSAEEKFVHLLRHHEVNLVILAGFMRVIREPLLAAFPHRILNIHPSLLPLHRGREAWRLALEAGDTVTGCTVHYVDNGVDTGEVIGQAEVDIFPDDTPETLHERIQRAEYLLYPMVIDYFVKGLL